MHTAMSSSCPSCGSENVVGAERCINCLLVLETSTSADAPPTAKCSAHPAMRAWGECSRCGSFLCELCDREFYKRDLKLCASCVAQHGEERKPVPIRGWLLLAIPS